MSDLGSPICDFGMFDAFAANGWDGSLKHLRGVSNLKCHEVPKQLISSYTHVLAIVMFIRPHGTTSSSSHPSASACLALLVRHATAGPMILQLMTNNPWLMNE